jgi:hypothetical protein
VNVILRSNTNIQSPILPQEEAEKALAEIGKARSEGSSVSLPWIDVGGVDIEAVHLAERADPGRRKVRTI